MIGLGMLIFIVMFFLSFSDDGHADDCECRGCCQKKYGQQFPPD